MTGPKVEDPNPPVVIQQFKGLNTVTAPERLAPGELVRATNIDIDDTGHVRRRRGFTRVLSGKFHSLFETEGGDLYAVRDGEIVRILPSDQTLALGATVGDAPLAYGQVGQQVFFTSRVRSGVIYPDDLIGPWGAADGQPTWVSPVVNPSPTLPDTRGKILGPPPLGEHLAVFNGRIYIAVDNVLWATELYLYHYVDRTRGFRMFEAPITMLEAVGNGLFVGTTEAVYFLQGAYAEARRETVMRVGAVKGSVVRVPSEAASPPQLRENNVSQTRPAIMFMTADGVCVGLDGGACYNLTENQMVFPEAVGAAAMFRQQDGVGQYVAVTNTNGAPVSTARIGDYVDAEIRRFTGA